MGGSTGPAIIRQTFPLENGNYRAILENDQIVSLAQIYARDHSTHLAGNSIPDLPAEITFDKLYTIELARGVLSGDQRAVTQPNTLHVLAASVILSALQVEDNDEAGS